MKDLRRLFDLLDPTPEVTTTPTTPEHGRLTTSPEDTRGVTMRFTGDFTVHLEIGRVLTGVVEPWAPEVEVRWPQGTTWAQVDEHGIFEVDDVPRGPIRLVIGDTATDWFVR
jgi:hypothetical protein